MTTDRTETLLHLVIAAFWVTAWGFMAAVGLTDWRLWTTLVLHVTFGVLLRRVIGQGHSLARFRSTVRWQTAIIVVGLLIQPDTFAILSPAVAMLAAMRLPRREGIAWTSVLGVLNLGSQINNNPSATGFFDGLIQSVIILAFAAFAHSLVQAKAARKQTQTVLADLQSAHSRLREYAEQVEELAVAEERNRISRDLHDTIGHRLTVSMVQLEGASRLVADDQARAIEMIDTVREQLDEGLNEVRRTVAMLRTPIGIDLSLPVALKQLGSDFERATQLTIVVSAPDSIPPLPEAQRLALYRAVQEALTNVQRHAQATSAKVDLEVHADAITVGVTDDGIGVDRDAASQGFGLRGMNERVTRLGGKVEIESTLGEGTAVVVTLPMGAADD